MKKNSPQDQSGFTVVELMVAMMIVGTLLAMSIIGWSVWSKDVAKKEAQSELNLIAAAMKNELNFTKAYPVSLPTSYKPSANVTATYKTGNSTQYCIEVKNIKTPTIVYYVSSTLNGARPVAGTCP